MTGRTKKDVPKRRRVRALGTSWPRGLTSACVGASFGNRDFWKGVGFRHAQSLQNVSSVWLVLAMLQHYRLLGSAHVLEDVDAICC